MRQALGALIWMRQTRPDVGFNITKIATDAVPDCTNGDLAWKLISLYNKTIRYVKKIPTGDPLRTVLLGCYSPEAITATISDFENYSICSLWIWISTGFP